MVMICISCLLYTSRCVQETVAAVRERKEIEQSGEDLEKLFFEITEGRGESQ